MHFKILVNLLLLVCLVTGCGPQLPEIVQARGSVSIDDNPLPNAVVKFIPLSEGLDGNHVSTATTDEDGIFSLSLRTGPGVYSGEHKVIVLDPEAPEAARAMTGDAAGEWTKFKDSLVNRPIPKQYQSVALTPLTFTIGAGQEDLEIELQR